MAGPLVEVPAILSPKPARVHGQVSASERRALPDLLPGPVSGPSGEAPEGIARLFARGWLTLTTGPDTWTVTLSPGGARRLVDVLPVVDPRLIGGGHGPAVAAVFTETRLLQRLSEATTWTRLERIEVHGAQVHLIASDGTPMLAAQWSGSRRDLFGPTSLTRRTLTEILARLTGLHGDHFAVDLPGRRVQPLPPRGHNPDWAITGPWQVLDAATDVGVAVTGPHAVLLAAERAAITVTCPVTAGRPEQHTVRWSASGPVFCDHPDVATDRVMAALAGHTQTCFTTLTPFTAAAPDGRTSGSDTRAALGGPARVLWTAASIVAAGERLPDPSAWPILFDGHPRPITRVLQALQDGGPVGQRLLLGDVGAPATAIEDWSKVGTASGPLAVWAHQRAITADQVAHWLEHGPFGEGTLARLGEWRGMPEEEPAPGDIAAWMDLGVTSYNYCRDWRLHGWSTGSAPRRAVRPAEFAAWIAAGVPARQVRAMVDEHGPTPP